MLSKCSARNEGVDCLKGIACIAVVLIHVRFPGLAGYICRVASQFAVPLFFAISGYFFTAGKGSLYASTARKLRHSIFLFLGSWTCCICFVAFGTGGMSLNCYIRGLLTEEWIVKLFLTNAPYVWLHLWFLGALIYIYLFALVLFGDGNRLCLAGVLSVILLVGIILFQELAIWLPFDPSISIGAKHIRFCHVFVFRALPFFLAGIWVSRFMIG